MVGLPDCFLTIQETPWICRFPRLPERSFCFWGVGCGSALLKLCCPRLLWLFPALSVPVLTSWTAGYGPVCPMVWEGVAARLLPIPIYASQFFKRKIMALHESKHASIGWNHNYASYQTCVAITDSICCWSSPERADRKSNPVADSITSILSKYSL